MRVLAIESHAVKCNGKAFRLIVAAKIVNTFVGAFRSALSGKLTARLFIFSLQRKNARRIWEEARHIFFFEKPQSIAPITSRFRFPAYRPPGKRKRETLPLKTLKLRGSPPICSSGG